MSLYRVDGSPPFQGARPDTCACRATATFCPMHPRKSGSQQDSPLEGGVSCELVSEMPNSLLAGKIQGNSPIRGLAAPRRPRKRARNQFLTGQFPTHPNREFFAALQGIKSGDQGSFRPDQGIPLSSAIWHSPLVTESDHWAVGRVARPRGRHDQRCRKAEDDAQECQDRHRCAHRSGSLSRFARSELRGEPRNTTPKALAKRAHRRWGTEGSNPSPSSGESVSLPNPLS